MQTRHRTPSIFNLYMIDVLCCALGCVILLLLLHVFRARDYEKKAQAKNEKQNALLDDAYWMLLELEQERTRLEESLDTKTVVAGSLEEQLQKARQRMADLEKALAASQKDYQAEKKEAARLQAKLEQTETLLAQARTVAAQVPDLEKDLKKVREEYLSEQTKLTKLEKDMIARLRELEEKSKTLEGLQKAKALLEEDLKKTGKTVEDLLAARATLEKAMAEKDKTLTAKDKALTAALPFEKKYTDAEKRILGLLEELATLKATQTKLEKGLTDRDKELILARANIQALQKDKKDLQAEALRVRLAVSNRFAGIELTGKRAIFLVDASGSMKLLDQDNTAPTKWQEVQTTIARLMRSLPDLEKFQVLVFGEETRYLLGNEGNWLDYDPKTSVGAVQKALARENPSGGTNLYAPLETAFLFRKQGLDTVYLLSDGLPDRGPGLLTEPPARTSRDIEALTRTIRDMLLKRWNPPAPGQPRVKINTIGFFYESPDVGSFLWALARENAGSFVGMSKP